MHELAWTVEQLGQAIQAERLAAAERYRLVTAVPRSCQSPTTVLARALRALASRLDGDGDTDAKSQPDGWIARAYDADPVTRPADAVSVTTPYRGRVDPTSA